MALSKSEDRKIKTYLAALLCLLSFAAQAQYYSPTPINGWVSGPTVPFRVFKASTGIVTVEGLVCKSATPGLCDGSVSGFELVAILPDGYKPTWEQRFPIVAGLQFGTMYITHAGEVYVLVPTGFWVSLTAAYFAP